MKKVVLIILLAFLLTPVFAQEKKVITVLDFSVNNVSENDMKSITSFLAAALFDTGIYRVIDASQRNAILEELSFSVSGCVDESCQLEIGKLLSAEMIVVGDIGLIGDRYILTAKLIETETSDTIKTAKGIFQDLNALIDGMYDFANDLAGTGLVSDQPAETVETPEATPLPESAETSKPGETTETESATATAGNADRIIAFSTLGAGIAMIGSGVYFMLDSIGKLNDAHDAEDAYMSATSDFVSLYDSYMDAFDAAENSNTMLMVGGGLIGGGIISTAISIIFFSKGPGETEPPVSVAVTPKSFHVRISY